MSQSDSENQNSNHVPASPPGGNNTPSTGLVVADQGFLPATAPATWQGMAAARPEILRNPFDPNWLLHSFRRRWILATGLGLLVGALLAGLVWWAAPAKSTAIALLELASVKPSEDYDLTKARHRTEDYDTYRATQLSAIKSHYVLSSALRQQGIAELASVGRSRAIRSSGFRLSSK